MNLCTNVLRKLLLSFIFTILYTAQGEAQQCVIIKTDGGQKVKAPLGLPDLEVPKDNPMTPEKVALGKRLYFDKRLSLDDTVSCASCHDLRLGGGDGRAVSTGIKGQKGGRSAPPTINAAYFNVQFWDGRAPSLEGQAKGPIVNPIEMGMPSHAVAVEKLKGIEGYRKAFQEAFGGDITIDAAARAIASYERTLLSGNSPFDRYMYGGEKGALNPMAKMGLVVFSGKGGCALCHPIGPDSALFTDNNFHNLGVGMDRPDPDLGRYNVTKQEKDKGAFKTPGLRNVALTAPYMHDGNELNLEAVVEFYDKGGKPNSHLSTTIRPLNLTSTEKAALVDFLKSLTSSDIPEF
ncbi:MAG TPA: cytochrome-c peroxidase [Candidatus Tripitaka californicus]|uniref:cytochrome-c peroxidase n=1 Tax=Candidatus Tripitaka californicus TaxID=3367616 RepID=UPI0040252083|nr:cytochrome-c peroxidase [Planctomycetota bacterium]